MRHFVLIFSVMTALAFVATPAHAQYSAHAEVESARTAPTTEDATATVTVVDPREDPRALVTTEELLLELPGTRPRQLGTLGSFSGVSVRGADADHTLVMLGEIPLGSTEGGAFDVSTLPLEALSRLEMWRGGSSTWLGGGAIGGVLRAVPSEAEGRRIGARLGLGSYELRTLSGDVRVRTASGIGFFGAVSLQGMRGDFPYVDDRGTRFDATDDLERKRANGRATQLSGLFRLNAPLFGGEAEAVAWVFDRQAGLPGPAIAPTRDAERVEGRHLYALAWTARHRAYGRDGRTQFVTSFTTQRNELVDRFGEVGLGVRATDDRTHRLFVRAAYERPISSWVDLTFVGSYQLERFAPNDAFARIATPDSSRHIGSLSAEARLLGKLGGRRWEIRPSARADLSHAALSDLRVDYLGTQASATRITPNARVGISYEALDSLSIVGSVFTGTRLPTTLEMFGDRGYLTGDASLRPERSIGADAGLFARIRTEAVRGTFEARGFFASVRDQIVFARSSQYTSTPVNLAQSRSLGLELGCDLALAERIHVRSALTWLDASSEARLLPLRSRLQAYGRVEGRMPALLGLEKVRAYVDVLHVGSNFADVANLIIVPARTQFGAGAGFEALNGLLGVDASIRDAFDARGVDVLGFPLPGRTFALTLSVRSDL
jgi:vitamin B12 transporter